jgi:CheY-like chemotaxis protein
MRTLLPAEEAQSHGRAKGFGMKTILLVDDDEPLRTLFGLALRGKGYCVIEADSGVAGLEMARKHLPDLILSDICMPGGDGVTFLRAIRRDPELKSRQVVLMSGRPDLLMPDKNVEDGADAFLLKSVGLQELLNCAAAQFNHASLSWKVETRMVA